jgi:hypothetical protein
LAAASLGIRIKPVDCHKVLELAQQINAAIDSLPDKQDATILQLINDAGLLQPTIAISVAQAAAQIALFYRSIE